MKAKTVRFVFSPFLLFQNPVYYILSLHSILMHLLVNATTTLAGCKGKEGNGMALNGAKKRIFIGNNLSQHLKGFSFRGILPHT